MSSQPKTFLTPAEYLALERQAERKSEYYDGEMFAMAGASRRHVPIVTNLAGELRQQLKRRPCMVYSTDLRLRVTATGLYTYPDVMVACGKLEFDDDHEDTLLNPTLIIEVLSKSTQNYGRGQKFEQYRALPSLAEYLTVAQGKAHIEHYLKEAEGRWQFTEFGGLHQTIQLPSLDCVLSMAEVYDKIEFPPG